ncbi:cytochrome c biogenesis protein [Aquibacillus koreensis]|uniref:Cytochrome c biogenesis protein n=1 Tax=Aquibacillus koreensis TaxID=279446 RepID=A0A9X3WIW9_9BACI|nr:cytochrome c biogenesis protein [Aquibacillus koreensis]MCT2537928.1 cytochrome c biogenesis protein [Aquibacillus koreensis]MDC3419181.1 cytochrome c biogenesis protein [Aquibacillus koreensis]
MLEIGWLVELILIIYGISVMGYFIDFIQHNRKVNRLAFWLLTMVWVLQTIFLIYQFFSKANFPVLSVNEGLFFYAWILVTFSLIMNHFLKVDFLVFFTNVLGFFMVVLHIAITSGNEGGVRGEAIVGEILIAHITLAMLSYGFFTLSFVFSVMFLLQYRLLKQKIGYKWLKRFGDLERLDQWSFQTIKIALPTLLLSMILGIVWAYSSGAEFYWYDIKTVGSIIVFIVYSIYLSLRLGARYQGKSISLFNTAAFLFLLINYFLFSTLSKFHI